MPENNGGSAMGMLFSCIFLIVWLGLIALVVAGWWKLFVKAGEPGWAAIVPIYNLIVLIKIAGKPIWWIVMAIIPCLNIIFLILVALEIAKAFGKDVGYAIGLFLLPMVFYPLLGFSNAQYQGTKSSF
jgi:hypothetical protein